jgi:hypothetical protein
MKEPGKKPSHEGTPAEAVAKPFIHNTIEFQYQKSRFFRVIHADGAFGGVSAGLQIHMALFNQRRPIPKKMVYELLPGGSLGQELKRESEPGMIREVEVDVVLTADTAKALITWLAEKVNDIEKSNLLAIQLANRGDDEVVIHSHGFAEVLGVQPQRLRCWAPVEPHG